MSRLAKTALILAALLLTGGVLGVQLQNALIDPPRPDATAVNAEAGDEAVYRDEDPVAEPYVPPNLDKVASPDEVWIDVSLDEQRVRIYQGTEPIREMVTSSGTQDSPTPLGSFEIQNRGDWFFSSTYQQGAKYWVSFLNWGEYLFHSVVMDDHQEIIAEEAAKLGQPASHGCLRLEVEDARWIYENIPQGTRVEIHE